MQDVVVKRRSLLEFPCRDNGRDDVHQRLTERNAVAAELMEDITVDGAVGVKGDDGSHYIAQRVLDHQAILTDKLFAKAL